jgi:hypothetical protein
VLVTDVFYYLHNFQLVLDSIESRYPDLLDETESRFIRMFGQLPQVSRALVVRMIMRKPRLFLAEQLQYAEIGAFGDAMAPLLSAAWVTDDPQLSIDDLFALFTKRRLVQLLGLSRGDAQLKKSALHERYRPLLPGAQSLQQWWPNAPAGIFRLDVSALCERLRLLYFGNFHQSWSEFVLADLGVRRFEQFDTTRARPFACRRHWDDFEQIHRCREWLHREEDPRRILAVVPNRIDGCDWLESRRQRLLFRIGQSLERANDAPAALSVYAQTSHPGAAVRAIRIQEASAEPSVTLLACEAAIQSCAHDQDRVLLGRARHRLRRRLGLDSAPQEYVAKSTPPMINLVLEQPDEPYSVEQQVGEFLMRQDPESQVYYVENCLMNGLFGLLCWRALFAPVAGAFFHPFHRQPADLTDTQFFQRRRELFSSCLAELEDGAYRRTILDNFSLKNGIDNAFIVWPVIHEAMLRAVLDCIPAKHLKAWFELMARDFQANRCGFPDLVQLWPKDRRYRLIEVKAPGDRLQDNQRRVLALCSSFEIPVALCRVRWSDRVAYES